jgi:hypothetical protein
MSASDTGTGNISVPPRDVFFADAEGVMAWRPVFDSIRVRIAPHGQRRIIARRDDVFVDFLLSAEQASHLAALLTAPAQKDDAA